MADKLEKQIRLRCDLHFDLTIGLFLRQHQHPQAEHLQRALR